MGSVRSHTFDAVIGVGGIGSQARAQGIAGKLTWIGIGTHKKSSNGNRGPQVTFDHFILFEEKGKKLHTIAPILARRMCSRNGARRLFTDKFNQVEQREIGRILNMAKTAPPSAGMEHRHSHAKSGRCCAGRR